MSNCFSFTSIRLIRTGACKTPAAAFRQDQYLNNKRSNAELFVTIVTDCLNRATFEGFHAQFHVCLGLGLLVDK